MPRTTLKSDPNTLNVTSTKQPLLLIELTNCGLDILRCAFPNRAKDKASNIVDLPAPFWPTTNVVLSFVKSTSEKLLPVDRKFFHLSVLNIIILLLGFGLLPSIQTFDV